MGLTELIAPDRIILGLRAVDKTQALDEIAKRASAHLAISSATIYTALAAREELGSTGFGRGFALPHVRLDGLPTLFSLLVRLAKPIPYDSIDRKPVDILFLLLMPPTEGGPHVAALAAISRSMRSDETLLAIRKAGSPSALFSLLLAAEQSKEQ
jgi:PTS system nitrogen regulatory IIA component